MEWVSYLPLIGGAVPLSISIYFIKKKGLGEISQLYFFLSLVCLGVFGISEGLAYMTSSETTAYVLLLTSKSGAFLFPYFIMAFATYLRTESKLPKLLAPPTMVMLIISLFFDFEGIYQTSWGWDINFNGPVYYSAYIYGLALLVIGLWSMGLLVKEMEEEQNPLHRNMSIIFVGYIFWTILALGTNIVVEALQLEMIQPLAFFQIFPSIIVAYGYLSGTGAGE